MPSVLLILICLLFSVSGGYFITQSIKDNNLYLFIGIMISTIGLFVTILSTYLIVN